MKSQSYLTNYSKIAVFIDVYEERLEKKEMIIKLRDSYIIIWFDHNKGKYQVLVNDQDSIDRFDVEVDNTTQNFLSEQ